MQHWVITEERLRRAAGQPSRGAAGGEGRGGQGRENSLGLTVPCSTTPSCFTKSILRTIASLHMCESTGVRVWLISGRDGEGGRERT